MKGHYRVFNDYEFLETKGKGSFGEVSTVRHKFSGFVRACKQIKIYNKQDADLLNTEIAVMKQLDHPNVVKLYQYYYDPSTGNMYLILEYCPGGSILDVLQNDGKVGVTM